MGQKRKVVYNCVCVHVCVCLYCIYYISLLIELGRRGERGGGRYLISLDLDFFPPSSYCGFEMSNGFDKAQKRAGKVKDCQESV